MIQVLNIYGIGDGHWFETYEEAEQHEKFYNTKCLVREFIDKQSGWNENSKNALFTLIMSNRHELHKILSNLDFLEL